MNIKLNVDRECLDLIRQITMQDFRTFRGSYASILKRSAIYRTVANKFSGDYTSWETVEY